MNAIHGNLSVLSWFYVWILEQFVCRCHRWVHRFFLQKCFKVQFKQQYKVQTMPK